MIAQREEVGMELSNGEEEFNSNEESCEEESQEEADVEEEEAETY